VGSDGGSLHWRVKKKTLQYNNHIITFCPQWKLWINKIAAVHGVIVVIGPRAFSGGKSWATYRSGPFSWA